MGMLLRPLFVCMGLAWASGSALAADVEAGSEGIVFESEDGDSQLRIGGRLHYDAVRYDDDLTPFPDEDGLRRLRLSLSGKFADDWRFRIERDVGGTSKGWKNVWLGFTGLDHWTFKAGNMIAPVGMEQLMSSNELPLMERSIASVLSPGFLTGVQAAYDRRGWTAALGYFTNPLDEELDSAGADGEGVAGRLTYAPLRSRGKALHFGVSFQQRSLDTGTDFQIRTRPGDGLSTQSLVDTGLLAGVRNTSTVGIEAGAILGPVSLLGERIRMSIDRAAAPGADLGGWHLTGAWVLTGESREYLKGIGAFGGIEPKRPWGALELAVRYDELDLEDADITGGRERNVSYGLNWYFRRNFRLMLNHVRAKADPNRDGLPETVGINQMRAQIDF